MSDSKPTLPGYFKPAVPGSVIRDPRTKRQLPPGGARVPSTTFWNRRLQAGEIVPAQKPTTAQPRRASTPPAREG